MNLCSIVKEVEMSLGATVVTADARVVESGSAANDLPYLKNTVDVRLCGTAFQNVVQGWTVTVDATDYQVVAHEYSPSVNISVTRAVRLDPIAKPFAEGVSAQIKKPVEHSGPNARTVDELAIDSVAVVIADNKPTQPRNEDLVQPTLQKRAYMLHDHAREVRENWSIHFGSTRYKILSVRGLNDLENLPWAVVEESGVAR